jgi:hypothetical protein
VNTVAFWLWLAVAVVSLGRLWSTLEAGLVAPASGLDALALATLAASLAVIGRVQRRTARLGER